MPSSHGEGLSRSTSSTVSNWAKHKIFVSPNRHKILHPLFYYILVSITKKEKIMYTPKPIKFSIVRQKKDNYNWYSVAMEHNGNFYILKEYSKSKARAMDYIRKIRTGSYKTIPTQSLENA